ncbi:MAG: recombinase family protein [Lachnospiraceae bacterium]|nr:recombinase family protein [Lachnospiraceae bacterium]
MENADSLAYQAGSAMAFILDNGLTFSGLYIDAAGYSALEALIRDSIAGIIDSVIVRDLDVLATDDAILNRLKGVPVVFIGADDLDSTRENLWVETLQYKLEEAYHTDDHREAVSKSVKDAVKAKRAEGRHTGLGIDPGTPDYLGKVRNACEGYEGLWNDWIESLRQLRNAYHKGLVRERLPQLWKPMYEYNPQIGMRAIESIKLGKDGRVETHFRAADVFS